MQRPCPSIARTARSICGLQSGLHVERSPTQLALRRPSKSRGGSYVADSGGGAGQRPRSQSRARSQVRNNDARGAGGTSSSQPPRALPKSALKAEPSGGDIDGSAGRGGKGQGRSDGGRGKGRDAAVVGKPQLPERGEPSPTTRVGGSSRAGKAGTTTPAVATARKWGDQPTPAVPAASSVAKVTIEPNPTAAVADAALVPRGALSPSEEAMLRFPDVWGAMKSLVIGGILPDQEELILGVSSEHFATGCMITLFILLASLTVMNMLVGVLCEVVSVVSAVEKETLLVNFVKSQLMALLETNGFDADGDNRISKVEFEALLGNEGAARALTDLGVDAVGLVDFIDFIFENGRSLTFSEFMEVVLELRGSNTATVKDIVDLRKVVLTELEKVKDLERVIEKSVAKFPLPEAAAG